MPNIVTIEDPADPRIEAYRDIRERDLVGRKGLFVAEGLVVLQKLIAAPAYRPLSLLVAAKRVPALTPLLASLPEEVPVFAAAQPVIDAVAGFPLHRGILAIGRRLADRSPDELLSELSGDGDVILLSGISNHDNMGGIFRNAAAFGLKAVLLDPSCCDPLYRKAIRVSVGASLLVPFARLAPAEDPIALMKRHGFDPIALSPAGEALLQDFQPAGRNSVLLGAEGHGLPQYLMRGVPVIRIGMVAEFDSLNVATTSGIVLHHLSTARPRLA